MSIAQNIKAREEYAEIVEFIGERPQRFWELMAQYANGKLPPAPAPVDPNPALTEQEAIRFEAVPVPYGKWMGYTVGEVECDYLLFLTEGDEFSKRLKRYVKSKRFQDRQEE